EPSTLPGAHSRPSPAASTVTASRLRVATAGAKRRCRRTLPSRSTGGRSCTAVSSIKASTTPSFRPPSSNKSPRALRRTRAAAEAAVEKAEAEWVRGEIAGATYERLVAKYGALRAAAEAEAAQLAQRLRQVTSTATELQAEHAALAQLAEARRQIVGRVREAG